MKKSNVFTLLFAVFVAFNLNAQSLTVNTSPDKVVQEGEVFSIDVKVTNFTDIVSSQFAILWDPQVLQYIGINNHNLPDAATDDNPNIMYANEGRVRFSWIDPNPLFTGFSLPDGTALFTVSFKAIGGPATMTMIEVASDDVHPAFPVEFTDSAEFEVTPEITSGKVTIDGVNASKETVTQDFTLFQNSPNPFTTETNISFNLNQKSQTIISIHDHAGRVIFERNDDFTGGLHTIQVSRDLFTSAGSYFFTLKTENATATRQLVVQ